MCDALLISYSGVLGGAERVLIEFAPAVPGECCLACPEGELAEQARAIGIHVFPLRGRPLDVRANPAAAVRHLAAFRRDVRSLARDLQPAVMIASGARAALALLLPRPAGTVVFMHHDLLAGPLIGRLVRRAADRAALVIVPSATVAADLGRGVIVHPGVDVDRFVNGGPPAQPPTALVLGALVPWKRPELALDALAAVRRARPELELRLRIVGSPLGEPGEAVARRLTERAATPGLAGFVELVGTSQDVAGELSRATCLLHCAPREPFGLAVVEALAAGRPVIAPAAGGPAEIVDESCALTYPPGDAVAAADALVKLATDPELAARLGAAGRTRAREHFDLRRAREQFAAALGPLTAPERPASGAPLAIVTVAHNSAPELKRLLRSAARHLADASVIVVDNASTDDSVEVARDAGATVIELPENVGFGRACNAGVAAVSEPVTALLNPDVELIDDSLRSLAAETAAHPDRLLAPLVLSPDGSRQDTVHARPASVADFAETVIPGHTFAPWRATKPRRVGWAVGCALVARTDTLQRLGPFDERIFLYGEDLELGLRTEIVFWPSARVVHTRARSSTRAFGGEPFELLARTRHDAIERRLGARRATVDDVLQAVTFGSRIALKRALGGDPSRERRQLRALRSLR
ncbi:MAG TPA: glycosyltransferase [Solirubrobacteraceae bacterium]|nr:glycosyltransferase [Solirubrobacteraceae bacterium]